MTSIKPVLSSFNPIAPLSVHEYERYLPTSFDESLSILEKINKVIKYMNEIGKISEDVITQWNTVMAWVMADGINDAINARLDILVTDGTLETIINENIFESLNTEIDTNKTDINKKVDDAIIALQAIIDALDLELNTKIDLKTSDIVLITETTVDEINAKIASVTLDNKTIKFVNKLITIDKPLLIPSNANIDFNYATVLRKAGSGAYDMIKNTEQTTGNINIKLHNLMVDGNKDVDSLTQVLDQHRFSGVKMTLVTELELNNVTVVKTVNGEDIQTTPASAIFLVSCQGKAKGLHAFDNDGTGVYLRFSDMDIDGSWTGRNVGSGISSRDAHKSKYRNIRTWDNGMSNLSVNGMESIVSDVLSWGSKFSGVNIGHSTDGVLAGTPSHRTQVTNVISFNNKLQGLTIEGSEDVQVSNYETYGNESHNIRITDSPRSMLSNIDSHDSKVGSGLYYLGGLGHMLDNARINSNAEYGIYGTSLAQLNLGDNVEMVNNSKKTAGCSGLALINLIDCKIGSIRATDNQGIKTQDSGIFIVGGSGHSIAPSLLEGNITNKIKLSSTPANLKILIPPVALTGFTSTLNGWTVTGDYSRDSIGNVHLSVVAEGGVGGQSCYQLPAGFRPYKQYQTLTINSALADYNNVVITTAGDIKPNKSTVKHEFHLVLKVATSALYV